MDSIGSFMFVVLFAATVVGETVWLHRKGWASGGSAVKFVLITDLVGFVLGLLVCLPFLFIFMVVFGHGGTGSAAADLVPRRLAFAAALILPALPLLFTKRAFLHFFKMQAGRPAWVYSLLVTLVLFAIIVLSSPSLWIFLVL